MRNMKQNRGKYIQLLFLLAFGFAIGAHAQTNPKNLVFIDKSLSDADFLSDNIDRSSANVIYLDTENYEGILKMTEVIDEYQDIQSIHIVGHGKPAEIFIGNDSFYGDDIYANRTLFESWKTHISTGADLMLYGCSIASTPEGKEFVENLSALTGMDVAASTNLTGQESMGGDWNLEYTVGSVETPIAFTPAIVNYAFTLQGLDYADLRNYSEVDEGTAGDGVWTYPDGSGRTAYQSANTSQPVYLLSTETGVINKVFKGTIKVDVSQTDNDDIGFAFGFQSVTNTYIWSWDKGGVTMEYRTNGGHLLYHKTTAASFTTLPGTFLGEVDNISERWVDGVTYQVEILYTSNRIRIKVDGVEKFDVSATDAGVAQFPAGRFGFYNYSQGNVTFGNQQTAPGSDDPIPPTAQDDSYGMAPNTTLTVDRLEGILKNDYDANLDGFTIVKVSNVSHGTLNLNTSDGSFVYTPTTNYQGADEFTYKLVEDGTGEESAVRTVSFGVIDNNQAPTDIQLSNNEVSEGAPLNAVIGEFTTSDANNPQDEHDYVLTNSDGGNFILSGNKLLVNNSSLTAGSRTIQVTSSDLFGESFTKSFTISVLTNNIPTSANSTIYTSKNADYTFSISDFPFSDDDTEDTFGGIRIETTETAGDLEYNGSDVFTASIIDDITKLVFRSPVDAAGAPYSSFTFKVFDSKGGISSSTYTMSINVVDAVTWTGTTDTDWNKATNWNPAVVPTVYVDATIPASGVSNFPVVNSAATAIVKNLTNNSTTNSAITVQAGGKLTINGTYTTVNGAEIKVTGAQ
ncbi:DUF4347 domain-containing protein [uncultured Draconibacterium sp.]|uniref:DUF4347 domain-containing protein n=1 Tax=uncultured Draconibacterium sp. TaxID=1573823 RepID=UPI0029C71A60|nr:DUF4347 domain-containing protein [uncultured Draconibacterium sp.]